MIKDPLADNPCIGHCVMIVPELWIRAENEMAYQCSQVQGFRYPDSANDTYRHVVRDLNMPAGHQEVWSGSENLQVSRDCEAKAKEQYDLLHAEMEKQIRYRRLALVWAHYRERVRSGAYSPKEEDDE